MRKKMKIIMVLLSIVYVSSCAQIDPLPGKDKISIISNPMTKQSAVQIITTQWTYNGDYETPCIKFKDEDQNTWIIICYDNVPAKCQVYFIPSETNKLKQEEIKLERLEHPYQNVYVIPQKELIGKPKSFLESRRVEFDRTVECYEEIEN